MGTEYIITVNYVEQQRKVKIKTQVKIVFTLAIK